MSAKHTPRPWEFDPETREIWGGMVIATVTEADDFPCIDPEDEGEAERCDEMCNANGLLIAVAPELLAELERLAESFGWPPEHPACVLIRKARGEA